MFRVCFNVSVLKLIKLFGICNMFMILDVLSFKLFICMLTEYQKFNVLLKVLLQELLQI